jgi:hypothetical protein
LHHRSFHQKFTSALQNAAIDSALLLQPNESADQKRRFDIYRNNRVVSLIDALRSTYPAVQQLVGDEFFKASARAFLDANPPVQPVMAEYGREFGGFISSLPNTDRLPFLRDVAELEWWKLQAYHCRDAPVLPASALADIAPQSIMDTRLECHPALHCIISEWPIGSIWMASTSKSGNTDSAQSGVDMKNGEAVVITRPQIDVQVSIVAAAGAEFLKLIQDGDALGTAAEQGLERDIGFNAGEHLTGLINLGAFSGIL